MADKITVIACEDDPQTRGYKILLSNGTEAHSRGAWVPGVEYVGEPTNEEAELQKARNDNAMLLRGLEEANATIATLTRERNEAQDNVDRLMQVRHTAPVPAGLIGVTTAMVKDLPSIEQMPSHPTLFPAKPGEIETPDQRDVREHLERKRAAKATLD